MANTKDIVRRQEDALGRIAKALGVEKSTLRGEARGNPQLARTIMLENIAAAAEKGPKAKAAPASEGK